MQSLNDGPRLTRGEYWILNQVVAAWCPIKFLAHADPKLLFNNPGHGLSLDRLSGVLAELFDRGWITSHRNGPNAFRGNLTSAEIAAALDQNLPPPSPARLEWIEQDSINYGL